MIKLSMPSLTFEDAYDACVAQVGSALVRSQLSTARSMLITCRDQYVSAGGLGSLWSLPQDSTLGAIPCLGEVRKLYKNQFRRAGTNARTFYESILSSTPLKRCPICLVGTVATLDHYLAISIYGHFSVLPQNLVPACRDCNTNKLSATATTAAAQPLHVYFDDFGAVEWLRASRSSGMPSSFTYFADHPDPTVAMRLDAHLATFGLKELFASNAGSELSLVVDRLRLLAASGGASAVEAYLHEEVGIQAARRPNSWQTAMYRALSTDDAFFGSLF